jgi:hypothetical protein
MSAHRRSRRQADSRADPRTAAAVPARPAIKTLFTVGSLLSTLADAHRRAANVAWASYLKYPYLAAKHLTDDNPLPCSLGISRACVFVFGANYPGETKKRKNK